MEKKLLFIDCDPGIDDAAALLLALADPTAEVLGVSAVGGNVPLSLTLRNALDLVSFAGREDVPVFAGAGQPLTSPPITAEEFHGANGLGGIQLPESHLAPQKEAAWDAMHRLAAAHPGELTLILLGPCTNAAIALVKWTGLSKLLKEIVIMGGATAFGNTSPAAEFNFLADPEAAEAVLQSGAKITICPLDLSHKSYLTPEEISDLAQLGSPQAAFTAAMLSGTVDYCQKKFGVPGSIVYDPAALLYALRPELFTAEPCWCGVETGGVHCRGKLVTDVFSDAQKPDNAALALEVDRPAFVQAFLELMGRYPAPGKGEGAHG